MRWLYERSRPARGAICRTVLLGWASGCLLIAQAFFLSRIIHAVVIEASPREALTGWFAGLAAAILLRAVAGCWRETSGFAAGARVRAAVRMELLGTGGRPGAGLHPAGAHRRPRERAGRAGGGAAGVLRPLPAAAGLGDPAAADDGRGGFSRELGGRPAAACHRPHDPALHDPGGHGGRECQPAPLPIPLPHERPLPGCAAGAGDAQTLRSQPGGGRRDRACFGRLPPAHHECAARRLPLLRGDRVFRLPVDRAGRGLPGDELPRVFQFRPVRAVDRAGRRPVRSAAGPGLLPAAA